MISPDFQSEQGISNSLPDAKTMEQQKLPGIRSLFPELSNKWAVEGSPDSLKTSMEIDNVYHGKMREHHKSPFGSLHQGGLNINGIVEQNPNSLALNSIRSPPAMLPALYAIPTSRPTASPVPTYAEYRTAQLRRPRSSPVSPTQERAWLREDLTPRRRRPSWERPNSIEPDFLEIPTLDDNRPPTAPSSVQSTPPHHYAALSYASVPRVRRVGSISMDSVPLSSRASSSRYQCTYCTKRFSRPSSLKIHENSHTGAKPFQCPEPGCGRNFSVMSNMRRHQKTHKVSTPPQHFVHLGSHPGSSFSDTSENGLQVPNQAYSLDHVSSEIPSSVQTFQAEHATIVRSKPRSFTSPT